jgi:UDPglucose 6-dehydrogenase
MVKICCIGAGYVGGPTMAVIALKCPDVEVAASLTFLFQISSSLSRSLRFFAVSLSQISPKHSS